MIEKLKKDPRVIGFIVGFGGVVVFGLIALVAWGLLSGPSPSPTLAPSAAPLSERVTVVAPASTQLATSAPSATQPSDTTPTQPSPIASPTRAEPIEYTVRAGDTLFNIALAYGVSVETIALANALEGETIVPGQVLVIPTQPLPTPTPHLIGDTLIHTVSSGDTLIGIAELYSVTVEAIQEANDLDSEIIQPGWELEIPVSDVKPQPTASVITETVETNGPWQPSILEGDLAAAYPLTLEGERFTLHYQPDTPAALVPGRMLQLIESALNHIETKLNIVLEDRFDIYLAGTLFPAPDQALRGRSFSSQRRNFYLYDETGTPDERRYIITHELTHLVMWNAVGEPSSVMLHEGVAVYNGIEAMEAAGFIPLTHFCAAYQQAGQLPSLSGSRSYLGHIRDLDLYSSAGCFVQYLIEMYGVQDFKVLFTDGDFLEIYGRTLAQLEADWEETLRSVGTDLGFDPEDLVAAVAEVADAYDRLFTDFSGTPSQMAAYRELDRARIAMLQAHFDEARAYLAEFEDLLQSQ